MSNIEKLSVEYNAALDSFVEQLQKDPNILAAFVYGSMVRGDIWSESDIDMLLVTKDESLPYQQHWVKDGDIIIQLDIHSRRNFRDWIEKLLHGSVLHHIIANGRLLFSRDPIINEYQKTAHEVGHKDKLLGMMIHANSAIGYLNKVRKNIVLKESPLTAFWWLSRSMEYLATLEVLSNGGVPVREVIFQAMDYNNELFSKGYTDHIQNETSLASLKEAYDLCIKYVESKANELFQPVVSFILEQGGHCGISQIDTHFRRKLRRDDNFTMINACEFIADLGIILRMAYPLRLTSKSRHEVHEAGYLHMEGELL